MSRPICWVCSGRLMYVDGKPVFSVIVDPIGAEHKVHKECFKREQQDRDDELLKDFRQRTGGTR